MLYFAASKVIWPSCDFQMRLRMLYKYIVLFDRVVTTGFDDPTMSIYSTPKYTYENHLCPHSLNWYWCIGLMLATTLWTDTHVSVASWQAVRIHSRSWIWWWAINLAHDYLNWYSCIGLMLAYLPTGTHVWAFSWQTVSNQVTFSERACIIDNHFVAFWDISLRVYTRSPVRWLSRTFVSPFVSLDN